MDNSGVMTVSKLVRNELPDRPDERQRVIGAVLQV